MRNIFIAVLIMVIGLSPTQAKKKKEEVKKDSHQHLMVSNGEA